MAVFVNEGKVADVFGPGMYKLTTQTLPVLTYLKNWDKLFQSPFKSDVYFFSTRQQLDRRWGTTQPVTIRDKDFGAVRLRAFGNYAYRIADPKLFHTAISGTRDRYTVDDLDGQLRGLMLQHISDAVAQSGVPFLDLAANQIEFAKQLQEATGASSAKLGLALEKRDGAERQPARGAAEDPRPEDRHGHGRRRHGQVHAVPDGAGDPRSSPRARRRRRRRGRRRRDGPGRRRGAGPGDGAAAQPGPARRLAPRRQRCRCRRKRPPASSPTK
jgi:hypothetical protein